MAQRIAVEGPFAAMQHMRWSRPGNSRSPLAVLFEKSVAVASLRIMHEEKTTVLCPSCKNRMSIRKIAQAMSEDARNFIYHCAICDIEIRQSAPQRSNAPVGRTQVSETLVLQPRRDGLRRIFAIGVRGSRAKGGENSSENTLKFLPCQ
jgi:hypothetical protein